MSDQIYFIPTSTGLPEFRIDSKMLKYNGLPKNIIHVGNDNIHDIYNNFRSTANIESHQTGIVANPILLGITLEHKNPSLLRIYLKSPISYGGDNEPYRDGWTNGIVCKLQNGDGLNLTFTDNEPLISNTDGEGNEFLIKKEFVVEQAPCEECWYNDPNNFQSPYAFATYPIHLRSSGVLKRWINTDGILSGDIEIFARLVANSKFDILDRELYPSSASPYIDLNDKFSGIYPFFSGKHVYFGGTLNPIPWRCPCQNFKSGIFFVEGTEDILNHFNKQKKIDILSQVQTLGLTFNTGYLWRLTGQDFIQFMKLDLVGPTGKRVTIHSGDNLNYWMNKSVLNNKVKAWSNCNYEKASCEEYLEFSGYAISGFHGDQLKGMWSLELYVYGKDNGYLTSWPMRASDIGMISPYDIDGKKLTDDVPGLRFLGVGSNRGLVLRYSGNIGAPIKNFIDNYEENILNKIDTINFILPTEFSGANISGNWELSIEDTYPNNSGVLYDWYLYFGDLSGIPLENVVNAM